MENYFCEHPMRVKIMHLCFHPPGLYIGDVSLGLFMRYDCLQHQTLNLKIIFQLQASSSSNFSELLFISTGRIAVSAVQNSLTSAEFSLNMRQRSKPLSPEKVTIYIKGKVSERNCKREKMKFKKHS